MGIHPHLPPISLLLGSPVPLPWLSDDSRADRATNDDGVKKGAEGKTAGSEDGRLKRSIDRGHTRFRVGVLFGFWLRPHGGPPPVATCSRSLPCLSGTLRKTLHSRP